MLEFELPYPPSVNRYYRNVRGRMLISREGRAYRRSVCALVAGTARKPLSCPLAVELHLYPPDRRRRDWDNFQKAVWDSLQHAGVFVDDSQIRKAGVEMHEPDGRPRAIAMIAALGSAESSLKRTAALRKADTV